MPTTHDRTATPSQPPAATDTPSPAVDYARQQVPPPPWTRQVLTRRRRRTSEILQRNAEWAAQARTAPTIHDWMHDCHR